MNYEELLEKAREIYESEDTPHVFKAWLLANIISPTNMSIEDDVKRRSTTQVFEYARSLDACNQYSRANIDKLIAWLEEPGEKSTIIDIDKMVMEYSQTKDGDFGFPVNCMIRAYRKGIEDVLKLLEPGKQPTDKVEPKFKVRDWVVLTAGELSTTLQIVNVDTNKKRYRFNDDSYLPIVDEECLHLWTINDAKDGDLIYVSTEIKGIQAIFHKFENGIIYFHCNLCGDFMQGGYEPSGDVKSVNPLLKEHYQRFFQKMKEAGYEWDSEKKELKKIEPKMLNADKVIGWMVCNIVEFEDVVELFKRDFGL